MADARKYAEWLVANQAKKGTPEFDTVARAYKAARTAPPSITALPLRAPSAETPEDPTVFGELGRGFEQYISSGETALGALFGDEEAAARRGLERQRQIAEEYGEGPSFGRLKDIYEDEGLLSALGSAVTQVPELVAQQVPQLAATAALAKAGALAGAPLGPYGAVIGGGLGAITSVLPQLAGANILRQAEEEPTDIDVGKAYGTAALQTAPELLGQYFTLGKGAVKALLGIANDADLDKVAARELTGAALAKLRGEASAPLYRAGVRAAAVEMPTEFAQQILERAQAGLDVASPEAFAEYGEVLYMAGMVGGALGPIGGVGERRAARGRLEQIAEQETQDKFAAQREQLDLGGQQDLGLAPVLSPETAAGAAQEEAARQQDLLREEYTTRGGEERFVPAGTFAERNLPTIATDEQAFAYMKEQGLTKAVERKMMPPKEQDILREVKAALNEAYIMQRVAAEAPRMLRAEGEAPLEIDPRKRISELSGEELDVLDRVLAQLTAKGTMPKGKGQGTVPKSYLPLVGEEATLAKKKEQERADAAAEKEAEGLEAARAKYAERVAAAEQKEAEGLEAARATYAERAAAQQERAAAAAQKEAEDLEAARATYAERAAAQQERADAAAQKESEELKAAQEAYAARATAKAKEAGLAEIAPKKIDLVESLKAKRTPIEQAQAESAEVLGRIAEKRTPSAPAPASAATTQPSVLPKDRKSLRALMPDANPGLGIFAENGPLAGRDLSKPAVAAQVKADLETAAQRYSGKNATAVDTFLKRPEFQAAQPTAQPTAPKAPKAPKAPEVSEAPKTTETTAPEVSKAPKTTETTAPEVSEAPKTTETTAPAVEETESNLGMQFSVDPTTKKRRVEKRIALSGADVQIAEFLAGEVETPKKRRGVTLNLSPEQAAAAFFREFDPESALRVMVAEGVPAYTESETVPTKADAKKAVSWVMENMSDTAREAVGKHAEDFKNILSRTKVTAKKRKLSDDIREARDAQKAEKEEQNLTKKVDKALRKQEKQSPTIIPKQVDAATREAIKEADTRAALETEALSADTAVGRSTRDPSKKELSRQIASQTKMFVMLGGKVEELPPAGPEQIRQVIGTKYLENAAASPKLEGDLLAAVQSGDLKKTISLLIGKAAGRPEVQQILRRIQSMGLKTKVVVGAVGKAGEYDYATDTITLDPELGLNEHTLVHELAHAALAARIADPESKIAKEFADFFAAVQNQLGGTYGGTDPQEFLAELMGNEEFATSLKAMKAPRGGNFLQRIVQAIAEFFNFRKGSSVYDEGIKYINKLLNVPASANPTIAGKLNMGTPTSATDALRQIGEARKPIDIEVLDEVRDSVGKMQEKGSDFVRESFFRLLRLDNIYAMYKDAGSKYRPFVRAVKQLIDAAEKRTGFIEQWIDDANKKYVKFTKVARKHKPAMKRMFDVAEKARINGLDLVPENNFQPTPEQQELYDQLKDVLNTLPPPVREMYLTMRKDYDAAYKKYREFMLEQYADNPTLYKEMRQKFEAEHPVAGYIPFMRFGDFVLEYTNPQTQRRTVRQFETRKERENAIKELNVPASEYREYSRIDEATYDPNRVPSSPFLTQVMKDLETKGASQQQLNSVYQAYLSMFPAESIMKRMMRSENVAGMSEDMIRAYANTMIQWARHMGNAMYTPQIDEALDTIASQRDVGTDPNLRAISNVLNSEDSRNFLHNPSYKSWVSGLAGVSYGAFILGNVASAVINLTSLPLLGLPLLGGRYGYGNATSAIAAATKLVTPLALKDMTGGTDVWAGLPSKYKKLIEVLNDHGQLQHTQTREILSGRRGETQIETNPLQRAALAGMDYGSRPFSATEKVNRAAMALAAYDLAISGNAGIKSMSETQAIQYALDTVKQVNTSGMAVTGPQLFQTDLGRIFGTFKTFAWNAAFVVGKSFYDSVKGVDVETRRIAQRQLLGTMAISAAISGVSGMPFVMMVATATRAVLSALFGDDEEDNKFITTDEWMQQYVNDLFWKGPLNAATNLAIADRTAITANLIFREDPKLVDDVGYVRATLLQTLGPAASYFGSISDGVKLMNEGHFGRGLEKILPSALGNLFKGFRFISEGSAMTKDGKVIMEDISTYNAVMQAVGFAPADLSELYERRGMAMDVQDKIRKRKDRLLDLMWAARQAGDEETFEEARDKLLALGKQYPGVVKQDTIQRSFRNKAANIRDSVSGLTLDASTRNQLIQRFELPTD